MIKARIRWCSCRVENILTLGKLLHLWFCFRLHSILIFISQSSYRTYKIISAVELARPIMGTIFLVVIPWLRGIIVDNCPDSRGRTRVRGQLAYDNPDVAMV